MTQLTRRFSKHLPTRAEVWSSKEDGIAFVDPQLPNALETEAVVDLLRVAAGEKVATDRSLSEPQLQLLRRHRVIPLIPDSWDLPDNWLEEKRRLALWSLALESHSRFAIDLLAAEGIKAVVLKGMATRYLDYENPQLRHSGDLDLLIDPSEIHIAEQVLLEHEFQRVVPERLGREFLKGIALYNSSGIEVDLHSRLNSDVRGSGSGLFRKRESIPHLGASGMSLEHRLIHAASHLFFSPPEFRRLNGLADITAIMRRPGLDIDHVRSRANELGLEGATFVALSAEAVISSRELPDPRVWESPTFWEGFAFSRSGRIRWAEQIFALSEIPEPRSKIRYLAQMLKPSREFLAHKGGARHYLSSKKS